MTKFNLIADVTISIYTTVEADTLQEAIAIANDRDIESSSFGHPQMEEEYWLSDEYDGSPNNIREED